jgi:DNA-binding FadR family transcriptional regulator
MAIQYQGLVTQGLARQIAEKIREAILDGRLKVDERLPSEEELATRFRVSRPTIREALKRLAAQHLIRSRRGPTGGNFVQQPSRDETRAMVGNAAALLVSMGAFSHADIAEARLGVERLCCELAASRRTDAQLEAMTAEILKQRDARLTDEEFCASDVRFHELLVEAAHNPALEFAAAGIIQSLQPVLNLLVFRHRERRLVAEQHQTIHDGLKANDANRAIAALVEYMDTLKLQYARVQSLREEADRKAGRGHHG